MIALAWDEVSILFGLIWGCAQKPLLAPAEIGRHMPRLSGAHPAMVAQFPEWTKEIETAGYTTKEKSPPTTKRWRGNEVDCVVPRLFQRQDEGFDVSNFLWLEDQAHWRHG